MASPRLKGRSLDLALRAAATRGGAALMRRLAFNDYRLDRLLDLPPELLAPLDGETRPIAGGAARMWSDQRLGAPEPPAGRATARALRAAFTAGTTSPSEVLTRALARIDAREFGPVTFSPFIALDRRRAMEAAEAADARYASGQSLGALDGIPTPVKDEVDVDGLPTFGGTAYLNSPATDDAFVVSRLRSAGAVVFGKTHTTEWGMSPVGINPHWDMPRNAHVPDRAAGGSSSGTGAAVALGLAPVGLGSDGGGSIRIPASVQGLFGLKPTYTRIGRTGDVFGMGTVAALGPIGQSAADLVDFMSIAAAERDPGDYACAYAPAGSPLPAWELALGRGVDGCRIGIPFAEWEDADARIAALCLDALRALEADGARLVEIELPHASVTQGIGVLTIGPESMSSVQDYEVDFGDRFGGELRMQFSILGTVASQEYLRAQRARAALRRSTAAALASGLDLIALPTLPVVAPVYPVIENRTHVCDDTATRQMCRYSFLANLTGLPAGTVPVGNVDGLPVGLQLVGDAWDEASVIAGLSHVERLGISAVPLSPAHRSLL